MKLVLLSVALLLVALAIPAVAADAKSPLDFKVEEHRRQAGRPVEVQGQSAC